jgi:hypothetical protein
MINKNKSAYFLSNNGLGDNILVNGALNYLSAYYEKIYFLCKDVNVHHIKYMYDNTNIIPLPFDSNNEFNSCKQILYNKYQENDVFISGCHKSYLETKKTINFNEDINTEYFIPSHFNFATDFYKDMNLNACIMFEYFNINITDEIINLYKDISNYKIIFLHSESSQSTINFNTIINKYKDLDEYLIISANENIYNENIDKYNIANKYIKLPTVIHYSQILINSEELHMIDSSISCLALCFKLSGKLLCKNFQIYNRFTNEEIDLSV